MGGGGGGAWRQGEQEEKGKDVIVMRENGEQGWLSRSQMESQA